MLVDWVDRAGDDLGQAAWVDRAGDNLGWGGWQTQQCTPWPALPSLGTDVPWLPSPERRVIADRSHIPEVLAETRLPVVHDTWTVEQRLGRWEDITKRIFGEAVSFGWGKARRPGCMQGGAAWALPLQRSGAVDAVAPPDGAKHPAAQHMSCREFWTGCRGMCPGASWRPAWQGRAGRECLVTQCKSSGSPGCPRPIMAAGSPSEFRRPAPDHVPVDAPCKRSAPLERRLSWHSCQRTTESGIDGTGDEPVSGLDRVLFGRSHTAVHPSPRLRAPFFCEEAGLARAT